MNKDNTFIISIKNGVTPEVRRKLDRFLADDMNCKICCEKSNGEQQDVEWCSTCSYVVCRVCLGKMFSNNDVNCPNCRKPFSIGQVILENSNA